MTEMKLRFLGDAHLNRGNNICRMSQGFQFEGKGNTNPDPWEDFPVLFCEILWGLWDHVMIFIIFSSTTIHSATFNLTHSMISPPSLGSGKNRNNWLNHLTLQSRGSPALICRLFTNPQISNLGLVHFPILPAQKSERVGTRAGCIFLCVGRVGDGSKEVTKLRRGAFQMETGSNEATNSKLSSCGESYEAPRVESLSHKTCR